ncbi:DUF6615 family protein [Priestia aryabhattai]|uniref:DUF6615 family protein n=1 Tax=Priestia aryabhattai TaxID=412384 RepID=UPI0020409CE7|nr:DUF6615 family protein [Priestia aryabhattai]MCM3255572.1 hypothetical protein [Priestia aryabhattai]
MSLFRLTRDVTPHLYRHLWRANAAGASVGEETLTDLFAIDLKLRSKKLGVDTRIIQCNTNLEKQSGADFLWYIGSEKYREWIVFFVQAKKSKFLTGKCKLAHNYRNPIPVGSRRTKIVRQIDNLVFKAEIIKATPLYCFYNFFEAPFLGGSIPYYLWKRKSGLRFPIYLIRPEEFSFTYVKAEHVSRLLSKKRGKNASQNRQTFKFEELKSFPFYSLFANLHTKDTSKTITKRLYSNSMLTYYKKL